MNPQLKGVESLAGTYVFDLARSAGALRLNRFLHGLTVPEKRALYKENPEAALTRAGLTDAEAYALCSLAVDFRIGEAVNTVQMVYGMIPKKLFRQDTGYWA